LQSSAGQEASALPGLHLPFKPTQQALSHPQMYWYLPDNTEIAPASIEATLSGDVNTGLTHK